VAIQENQAVVTHDPLPEVLGDETQLVQLFQNLIANAIKFHGKKKPKVHISASLTNRSSLPINEAGGSWGLRGDVWLFSVRDNGIGIDPRYADRIFIIFQRLNDRTKYPGTGIGLALCRKIVQRHGGQIWVESSPGAGATFFFTLPPKGDK
jgi:signal transduction histidine kinase